MTKMTPRACWYCEGTVHFDSDEIGDCDDCGETYSFSEFLEREQGVIVYPLEPGAPPPKQLLWNDIETSTDATRSPEELF